MSSKIIHRLPRLRVLARLAVISLSIVLLASLGCEGGCGCDGGGVPSSASERVEDMGEHLPAETEMAFVVADLAEMRTALQTAREQLGDAVPMADIIQKQAQSELGLDIMDAESWKKSGIAPDSGLVVGFIGESPVVVTYVADQQKFEKSFADQIKKSYGIEGMVKNETVSDQQVKVLGSKEQKVSWAYDGKLVVVAFPQVEQAAVIQPEDAKKLPTGKKLVARLIAQDAAKSLSSVEGYQKFNKALAPKESMALFLNSEVLITEERLEKVRAQTNETGSSITDWLAENARGLALSLTVEGNSVRLRGWMGMPDKLAQRAKAIAKAPKSAPLANYATKNTMIGLRTSLDFPKAWELYKEVLPEKQRKQLLSDFEQMASSANLDVEKDIITKISGNLAVLLYGINKSVLQETGAGIIQTAMARPFDFLALIVPVQFQDTASVDKLAKTVIDQGAGMVQRQKVADGVEVLGIKNVKESPGKLYLQKDLMVYATGLFSNESVHEYMTGNRSEGQLTEVAELDLGKEFATAKTYNGLYLNFVRAREQMGDVLASDMPQIAAVIGKLEEAALTTEVDDTGAYLNLAVDLTPQPEKAEGSDKAKQ